MDRINQLFEMEASLLSLRREIRHNRLYLTFIHVRAYLIRSGPAGQSRWIAVKLNKSRSCVKILHAVYFC